MSKYIIVEYNSQAMFGNRNNLSSGSIRILEDELGQWVRERLSGGGILIITEIKELK